VLSALLNVAICLLRLVTGIASLRGGLYSLVVISIVLSFYAVSIAQAISPIAIHFSVAWSVVCRLS